MAVYLDYAATSPIRAEVLEVYLEHLSVTGNPSSVHSFGQGARKLLEEARESISRSLDCNRSEVIFTSGGTESNNLAVKGLFWHRQTNQPRPLILSAYTEHHAVIDPIEWLVADQGAEVAWIPVNELGEVDLVWLELYLAANHDRVALISLMWANNEVGVVTPIHSVTELASRFDVPVHSDAVAAVGHIEVSFASSGLSTMAISGHKLGAPVGVGALIVSRATKLVSVQHGGGQERSMRSGTMNSAAAKALSRALELAVQEVEARRLRLGQMRDRLVDRVLEISPDIRVTSLGANRLPDNAHFTFGGCSGDSLLFLLDAAGFAVSNGSACQAGVAVASHVLIAMGRSEAEASGCIRVSLGLSTTDEDIEALLEEFPRAYASAKRAGLPNGQQSR